MTLKDCFLPTLSEIFAREDADHHQDLFLGVSEERRPFHRQGQRLRAEQEWYGAIAAINQLLGQSLNSPDFSANSSGYQGLILSGPTPILTHPFLVNNIANYIFTNTPETIDNWSRLQRFHGFPLLPGSHPIDPSINPNPSVLPLLQGDPLGSEQFCLVLTEKFSLVMVLGTDINGLASFQFSFEPELIEAAWEVLQERIKDSEALFINPDSRTHISVGPRNFNAHHLEQMYQQFFPRIPDYKIVTKFTRLLLQYFPSELRGDSGPIRSGNGRKESPFVPEKDGKKTRTFESGKQQEVELLQAIAHEVRTPLATIRTLTRLLLKRRNLAPEVLKRLEMIDTECTAQIDRFNLIFRAAELGVSDLKSSESDLIQTSDHPQKTGMIHLTAISVHQIFQSSFPRWQKQASQRSHTLELILPQKLPTVVSDPTMLDQVLTGLIDNFTRSLPIASHILVEVMTAGNQLKLQLESQPRSPSSSHTLNAKKYALKSIGPLLMFQPETGSLTLNIAVTKHLFQAMGGKLVVRQKAQQGEVMTIFLPLQ